MNPFDWLLHPRQTTANLRRRLRRDRIHIKVWLGWVILLVLVAVAVVATVVFWGWISNDLWTWLGTTLGGQERLESNSTTLRNVGLLIAGAIAVPLAVWRSIVAQRQAKTAQQDLLNDRYQKGAEMLGNEVLSVRLGGIYALQRLAEEHPEQYHIQIMRLFCAFVRSPTMYNGSETKEELMRTKSDTEETRGDKRPQLPEDVKAIMEAIRVRSKKNIALEQKSEFKLTSYRGPLLEMDTPEESFQDLQLRFASLSGADLRGVDLYGTDLRGIDLRDSKLQGATLVGANLSGVKLSKAKLSRAKLVVAKLSFADLSGAKLRGANLFGAGFLVTNLQEADLSGANIQNAEMLTQKQLDEACADPGNPPQLIDAVDYISGKLLVWRGKPLDDEA